MVIHEEGISAHVQRRIDDIFMPSSIKKQLVEIKELQRLGKLEFGDEPFPKTLTTTSKKGGGNDVKKDDKPDDVVITPDGETFTLAQDEALIDLKIKGKTWAEIATELGKEKDALNNRWRDIRPADWEARAAEEEEKKKKKNSGGGGGSGGKKGKGNQNNQNNQDLQQGGGKGNVNNQQQHEGKKGKNNQQDNKAQNKKQQEAQADAGADNGNEAVSDAGTWAVADDNFTEKEVTVLEKIVEIELRNAFVRIAKSFAAHKDGKRVHPDSIAQKVLGEGLDLSSLGGL